VARAWLRPQVVSRTTPWLLAALLAGCAAGPTDLRFSVRSPDGLAPNGRADAFPIAFDVENVGDRPVRLRRVVTRIAIQRDGRTVCADPQPRSLPLRGEDAVVPPRSTRHLVRPAPCGLDEVGDYEVVAEVRFEADS
jgi:hypothetical protein